MNLRSRRTLRNVLPLLDWADHRPIRNPLTWQARLLRDRFGLSEAVAREAARNLYRGCE